MGIIRLEKMIMKDEVYNVGARLEEPMSNESMASVLRSYANDVERYGKPLDSGLYGFLRKVANRLEE